MKKTMLTAAVLVTMLVASCSKNAMVGPDQPSTANARAGASTQTVTLTAPLPTSTLPAGVKTYLDQKYAGYSLIKVDRKREPGTTTFAGTKVVFLQNGTVFDLNFDASNALVAAPTGPQGGPTPPAPAGNHSVSYVSRAELPAAVASVISSSTYSTYTYGWTELHVHDGQTQYDVKLFSNNQPTTLHLSASGTTVTPTPPAGPGAPVSGTATAPVSGTATPPKPAGPGSGTATAPGSGTATPPASGTAVPPKPPRPNGPAPTAPGSMTATPANRSFILDGSKVPSAIGSYLQTNFSGYTFLAAEQSTPPTGTTSEYTVDIAVGKQLYKLRFTANGDLLMAEARN
ncbi:PepSY-like domain-containing protein [Spirosoma rhododendri]|uniref:Beta-lactamase-inhibitor-like PepSY-like domain-containing protein n=1 Tax=Spirosoma rhododendri TaxID=2728024 RepID=A0A7L5DJC5_9BACT|nr:PepSY-like domain-containing protein [Spirosoma rhododendri]QJD78524.1 hypothetical protein HH216_08875 [Spirosoma rhododendri]